MTKAKALLAALALVHLVVVTRSATGDVVQAGEEFQVNQFTTGSQTRASVSAPAPGKFIVVWDGQVSPTNLTDVIWARLFTLSASQGDADEFIVNSSTSVSSDREAVVAGLSTEDFVVVWENDYLIDGSREGIFGRIVDRDGALIASRFQVNTYTTNTQEAPTVAARGDGSFVVVWRDVGDPLDQERSHIAARLFDQAAKPLTDEIRIASGPTGIPRDPRVAALPNGEFVVTWSELYVDGSDDTVVARRIGADGSPIGPEFPVNTFTTGHQRSADVAGCTDGSFIVAWISFFQDGSEVGVYGQRFNPGGLPTGTEFQVNSYTTDTQTTPVVAATTDCTVVVAWQGFSQDGDGSGVFARLFPADGTPLAEFQVNTYTTGYQGGEVNRGLGVALDPDGVITFAYPSQGLDGDRNGIAARRFCIPPGGFATCGDVVCTGLGAVGRQDEGSISAPDALRTLRGATGADTCDPCECDVDSSGTTTATDALLILLTAVGQSVPLVCPPCSG